MNEGAGELRVSKTLFYTGDEENRRAKGEKDAYRVADLLYQKAGWKKAEQKIRA